MKSIIHYFQVAFKNIWLEKWINLLAILSISIGLLIICGFALITLNIDSVLKQWAGGFGIVVYLDAKTGEYTEEALKNQFMQDRDILEVKYISKEQALKDVKHALGEDSIILDDIKENPLPASFELKIKNELLEPLFIKEKSSRIKQMTGVADVQYGEKWLSSLNKISHSMKVGVIVFGCAIFIAVTFITYCTIKIFFYRRKEEIETMKLLGATKTFIKLPFLIEGLFIKTVGGIISSMLIFSAYSFTTLRIAEFMPSIRLIMAVFPYQAYLLIPLVGAFMSLIGSYIAIGKIRY